MFRQSWRVAYVLNHILATLGIICGTTLMLSMLIQIFLTRGAPDFGLAWRFLKVVLWEDPRSDKMMVLVFRICIYALPVSLYFMKLMRRKVGLNDAEINAKDRESLS